MGTDELNELEVLRLQVRSLNKRKDELETCLNRMVLAYENTLSESEGKWPQPDSGCIECTCGTVPNRYNTGLCAYHTAKKLLGHA